MAWHPGVLRSHLGERRMAPGPAGAKIHGNIVALSRANGVGGEIFGPTVPSEAYFSRCFPSSRPARARCHAETGRYRETRRRGLTSVRPQPAAVDRSLDGFRLRFEILRPLPKLLPGQLAPLAADVALHDHLERRA